MSRWSRARSVGRVLAGLLLLVGLCGIYTFGSSRIDVIPSLPFRLGPEYDRAVVASRIDQFARAAGRICKNGSRNRAIAALRLREEFARYCP